MTQRRLRKTTAPSRVGKLTGESGDVYRMYINGWAQKDIAEHFGITRGRVSQIINAARMELPPVELEQMKRDTLELIRSRILVTVTLADEGDSSAERNLHRWVDSLKKLVGADAPVTIRAAFGEEGVRYEIVMDEDVLKALQ